MQKDVAVISVEKLPEFFSPRQLADVFGICKAKAYQLSASKGFPSIRFGKRIVIHRDKLIEWIDQNFIV